MAESQYQSSVKLLETINRSLSRNITEPSPYVLFRRLLDDLLAWAGSDSGFIGEVFYSTEGLPYIQSYATTNIGWSGETLRLYEQTAQKGRVFAKLDSLYGEVLKTTSPVICNDPLNDPRSGCLPTCYPPLSCFLGLPFFCDQELQGVIGIANRPQGYDQSMIDQLSPFLSTCSDLICIYGKNFRRQQVEDELLSYKQQLMGVTDKNGIKKQPLTPPPAVSVVTLDNGYHYRLGNRTLMCRQQKVHLTRKESLLFHILVTQLDQMVPYSELERQIWPTVIVDVSSLRSLLRRLRQKVTGLTIKTVAGIGCLLQADQSASS